MATRCELFYSEYSKLLNNSKHSFVPKKKRHDEIIEFLLQSKTVVATDERRNWKYR
jgi:hypothetical protein